VFVTCDRKIGEVLERLFASLGADFLLLCQPALSASGTWRSSIIFDM
jgi:hypothetical protein